MSMYNLMFGSTQQKLPILALAGVDPERVGRFRDLWLEKSEVEGELILAIYTRNGGGNRQDYFEEIQYLHGLPGFVSDRDDEFDSTYATFRIRLTPASLSAKALALSDLSPEETWEIFQTHATEPVNTDERWQGAIADLGKGVA